MTRPNGRPTRLTRLWQAAPAQVVFGSIFIVTAIVLFIVGFVVASDRAFSNLENFFYQIFFAILGILGGWLISTALARTSERAKMEDRSTSAVRKSFQLLTGLLDIDATARAQLDGLDESGDAKVDAAAVRLILRTIQVHAETRIAVADDAIRDWRDIAPEAVDSELERLQQNDDTRRRRTR